MFELRGLIKKMVMETLRDMPYGVAYTGAIVENEEDVQKMVFTAIEEMDKMNISDKGWFEPENYHMTICLGELSLHMKMRGDLNKEVQLQLTHFGYSDKAIAFKVHGYMSKNDMQHITMFFRDKPSDSKEIRNWVELELPFSVSAVIREVAKNRP